MKPLLSSIFLDTYRLLEHYYLKGFIDNPKRIEEYIFAEIHTKDPYKPDYVYKNVMQDFMKDKSLGTLTIDSLKELSSLLEFRGNKVYVKNKSFERWQEIILSVSPLMIISYLIYEQSKQSFRINIEAIISSVFDKSVLPSIFDPQLDSIIKKDGLNEMHMHLNGATEADFVWQDALSEPSKFYTHFRESFGNTYVTDQYLQFGNFEKDDFFRLLIIARQLRDTIIGVVFDNNELKVDESFTKDGYDLGKYLSYASSIHPLKDIDLEVSFQSSWQYEALLFVRSFQYLESKQSIYFANIFHYYLLIYALFQKMLVQQKRQVGFDQFQKITLNQIRELTEEKYQNRYRQFHGMYDDSLSVLEGRFAPKDNLLKSLNLLKSIRDGYVKNRKSFKLILVPHFIKTSDTRKPKNIITFRDLALRIKTKQTLEVLLNTMNHPNYNDLIVGFDAAANELHASPDAFAPTFRKLRFLGYSNFTYHAGEDFIHILSGLRMVYEAIEFLDMRSGNRIGHATALGIDPKLWINRLYESKLTLKKGEWLDNLIFVYELIQSDGKYYGHLGKLQGEILKYFQEIYNYQKPLNIHQIIESWKARKYDPIIALGWRDPSIFEEFDSQEFKAFNELNITVQELYELYHTGECIEKYNTMIQIEPDQAPFFEDTLRDLQNIMIQHVNNKNIVLETLPTSNVRISYYKRYEEHHLWRWLGLENYKEGDLKPTVVVGSDDTGIFMTNLRNEYAHIYQTVSKLKNSQIALNIIKELNANSKVFTFHL